MTIDVVIPTIGRPSLWVLLASLAREAPAFPGRVIVVDDRKDPQALLTFDAVEPGLRQRIETVAGDARGPAAARNRGWQRSQAEWIAFLDDDVTLCEGWYAALLRDLRAADEGVAASQAALTVPLDPSRSPTDWERNVAGLERSLWITADMAYRRSVLQQLGGFDERFRRAYREDSDLALRAIDAGFTIKRGTRRCLHPVRPADRWISVRLQQGNSDDVLMRLLHGRHWRERAGAPHGAWPRHAAAVAAAAAAVLGTAAWLGLTGRFAIERLAPGPRTPDEIATMLATSAVIPFAAVYHRLRGYGRIPRWLAQGRS